MLSAVESNISGGHGFGPPAVADEWLMEKIRQRQPGALRELYSRHAQMLRGVIGSVVCEESDADDVLQESFVQIWREAARYSEEAGKPLGWVVTIARRRAIDRVRRRACYRRAKERFEQVTKPAETFGPRHAMETEITQKDLRRFLGRQMENLPNEQREAIELAYFGGLSQREIAATTRTPLGTVKTRLQLGLRKLTQCIRPLQHKI